jgi:mannosyltransferase
LCDYSKQIMATQKLSVTLDGIVFGLQTYGGISNYWGRLVRHLNTVPEINTHIVLPKRLKYAEYDAKWEARSSKRTERLPAAATRYFDVTIDKPCDIFHSSYYRIPADKSTKYVVTVYDFIYERYRQGPARWIHTHQKLRSIRRADAIICISQATREDVLRNVPDIDPSRVHVVYLGVDQSMFFPDQSDHSTEMQGTVLFVGQRGGYKRFDLAVDALVLCPELLLGIVGPALLRQEIEILESRLPGRWHLYGSVSSSELRKLYSSAFAFIFPSDYEGFGLPILEAMACGCPVVAAHTASLPEVGGGAALYALEQRADMFAVALNRLQNSTTDRQAVIDHSLMHATMFSWDRTFNSTFAHYQSGK